MNSINCASSSSSSSSLAGVIAGGIAVRCGAAVVDTNGRFRGFKKLL
jgi:hypothetical protein